MNYQETVLRFRVLKNEELPAAHQAAYRADGIDPDNIWSLVWSFETREAAEAQVQLEQAKVRPWRVTWKIEDAGEATTITRSVS